MGGGGGAREARGRGGAGWGVAGMGGGVGGWAADGDGAGMAGHVMCGAYSRIYCHCSVRTQDRRVTICICGAWECDRP